MTQEKARKHLMHAIDYRNHLRSEYLRLYRFEVKTFGSIRENFLDNSLENIIADIKEINTTISGYERIIKK